MKPSAASPLTPLAVTVLALLPVACSSDDPGAGPASGGAGGSAASATLTGGGAADGGAAQGGAGEEPSGGSGDSSGSGSGEDPGPEGGHGPGGSEPVGLFALSLVGEETVNDTVNPAHATFRGSVEDGPAVPKKIWQTTAEAGGCKLLEPYTPFCEIDCGVDTCVADGVCRQQPGSFDLGTVILSNVETEGGATEVELLAVTGVYQVPGSVKLAYPPADEGTLITVTSDGVPTEGSPLPLLAAFSLQAPSIAPLVITSGDTVPMDRDEVVTITWEPPRDPALTRIFVEVDISHHGGQKGQIDCEIEDTGSLSIPSDVVTGLINLGVAGYPDLKISRRATGSTDTGPGPVELRIISQVTMPVSIPWLQSCSPTEEDPSGGCPEGTTCGDTLLCE